MKVACNITLAVKKLFQKLSNAIKQEEGCYKPAYRVVRIEEESKDEFIVTIQMIGKKISYKEKPEKILADDKMVNLFSPVDIRNLTYLGYLGVNAPKYRILAKQFSDKTDQTLFAIHKKGDKTHQVFTANEISGNNEVLESLNQKDAHTVGYTTATEQTAIEIKEQEKLKKQLNNPKAKTN
jgi:hypothetical protein